MPLRLPIYLQLSNRAYFLHLVFLSSIRESVRKTSPFTIENANRKRWDYLYQMNANSINPRQLRMRDSLPAATPFRTIFSRT